MKDKYVLKTRICSVLLHVFLLLMVAIILLPVCWLVLNSLKTNQEMFLNSLALTKKMDVCQLRNCMGLKTSLLL